MLHTLHEMLIDHPRQSNAPLIHVIVPVLLAFKERGGFDALNTMLRIFAKEIEKDPQDTSDSTKSRLAPLGMKKILELYVLIVHGKNITDAIAQLELVSRSSERQHGQVGGQLVVELRMSILPIARELWESGIVEKITTPMLSKLVEILKTIAVADQEATAYQKKDKTPPPVLFSREKVPFSWAACKAALSQLVENGGYDEDLAREAIYRAQGDQNAAKEYCRAHKAGVAGARNPIPPDDAFQLPPAPEQNGSKDTTPGLGASGLPPDAMILDAGPELERFLDDGALVGELLGNGNLSREGSSDHERDTPSQTSEPQDASGTSSAPAGQEAVPPPPQETAPEGRVIITKDALDEERAKLNVDLIDRCLDVIRAHPDSVYEISDLISATILKSKSDDGRQEVGETLANALMSFAIDDEVKKSSARSIAAYAHLLSMLLQESEAFFRCTVKTLRDNIGEYLGFLKVPSGAASEELPPWLPYILLIFEIILSDDEEVVEVKWKVPTSESDTLESPVIQAKEPIVTEEERHVLLDAILEILPRIGKEEMLAVAVLRILVILTRDRSIAKIIGEKKNLQRLFVMAKQLSGIGATHLKETRITTNILIILRHIIEDEEVIRQIMRTEIRSFIDNHNRGGRGCEINIYTRGLSHIAFRAPDLFVEVTSEMLKLSSRWFATPNEGSFRSSSATLALKESASGAPSVEQPKDDPVEPAVQATEDLNINDVRPSTETSGKATTDAPKTPAHDHKRPVVENPDGVVTFLLEQLLNYQKVDDVELAVVSKETQVAGEPAPSVSGDQSSNAVGANALSERNDKRSSKLPFKPEDHPIFIYRCFLLHCLAELVQSYGRCKIEFLNFKRGATLQTNTPVKPRSTVLNYLLNDLLCANSVPSPGDAIATKKKAATSEQARFVLVALVTNSGERVIDRTRDRYEFDDDPDLLFVRKFVVDTILKAYKEASTPSEPFDVRYAKMLSLASLMNHMTGGKDKDTNVLPEANSTRSQNQIRRLMYEKGFLATMTVSIADIDLTFPDVKQTIKYILRVLRVLTNTAIYLSRSNMISTSPDVEDEIASASSLSEMEDDREETPDLYRNSALGMMEPRDEDDFSEDSEDGMSCCDSLPCARLTLAGDQEMYEDEYDEDMDYGDEISADDEENISDEDDLNEIGAMEGLSENVEVIMGENEDDDDSMDEDEEDPDEVGSADIEEIEEIIAGDDDAMDEEGGSGWGEETSDDGDEGEDADFDEVEQGEAARVVGGHDLDSEPLTRMFRAAMDGDDFPPFDDYVDDGGEEGEFRAKHTCTHTGGSYRGC